MVHAHLLPAASAFIVAGTATGIVIGAAAGATAGLLDEELRRGVVWIVTVGGACWFALDLWRGPLPFPELDRQTEKYWLEEGSLRWAAKTGAALATGGMTRIGFPIWYVVPLGALGSGSATGAAAVWATYGFVRTFASSVLGWWALEHRRSFRDLGLRFISKRAAVRRATDVVAIGVMATVVIAWA